jgi:hypothetical protein
VAEVLASERFAAEVQGLVDSNGLSYMDAVVHWCHRNGFEVEYGAALVKKASKIKKAIRSEAEQLSLMRK